jgi:hypothetical protein
MKKFSISSSQILSPARKQGSRGARGFNFGAAALRGGLLALCLVGGIGVAQAQQPPDPLTITKDGNVGISTTAPNGKMEISVSSDSKPEVLVLTQSTPTWDTTDKFNAFRFIRTKFAGNQADGPFRQFNVGGGGVSIGYSNVPAFGSADALYVNGNVGIGTTAPANKFSVTGNADFSGNVGIGTTVPANKLSVAGNADFSGNVGVGVTNPQFGKLQVAGGGTVALRLDANTGVAALSIGGTGQLNVDAVGVTGGRFIVKDNGNVGIGTNNPTKAKLEISGGVNQSVRQFGFLNANGATGRFDKPQIEALTYSYSIWADNHIAAVEFNAFSDERIKNIQGRSDSASDLRTLLGIEITDYRYKDVIGKGNGAYKKVVGQQVEKVFPQAVSKQTDVVPDIYQQASIQDGWVTLTTDLKKGERVKLITEKGEESIHEVLEATPDKFRVDFNREGDRVFVFGRQVNDFLTVDYDAIAMLNVSATQQLKKEKDAELKALEDKNTALRSQLAAQEKRLAELEAKDKTREEKLAAIETLLLSGDKPAARTSLKKVDDSVAPNRDPR